MDISRGVDYATVFEYFKMNMRPSRTTTTAHQADDFAFADDIARFYFQIFMMAVTSGVATTMVDFHHLAVAISRISIDDNTCGN